MLCATWPLPVLSLQFSHQWTIRCWYTYPCLPQNLMFHVHANLHTVLQLSINFQAVTKQIFFQLTSCFVWLFLDSSRISFSWNWRRLSAYSVVERLATTTTSSSLCFFVWCILACCIVVEIVWQLAGLISPCPTFFAIPFCGMRGRHFAAIRGVDEKILTPAFKHLSQSM